MNREINYAQEERVDACVGRCIHSVSLICMCALLHELASVHLCLQTAQSVGPFDRV